jgi:hypothetical protein
MRKCVACQKEIRSGGLVISMDGDFVCDQKCKKLFNDQLSYLCEEVFVNEEKTTDFVLGKTDYPSHLRR